MIAHLRGTRRKLLLCLLLIVSGSFLGGAALHAASVGWRIKFDGSGSRPVIADGVLYVGSADGAVYALDPGTGAAIWRFQTGDGLTSGPQIITVPRGTNFNDQVNAALIAAEKGRGEGTRRVDMTPAVDKGTVFIGSGDRSFYAIDAATGKKNWSYEAGGGMASNNNSSSPVPAATIHNGTVFFVTQDGLHALDALTGKRKYLFETLREIPIENMNTRSKRTPSAPVMGDGVIFLTAWPFSLVDTPQARMSSLPPRSFVYAVDPESGKEKWGIRVDGSNITAPLAAKGLVFFAVQEPAPLTSPSNRLTLYAIDAAGGQIKWKFGADRGYGTAQLLIADNAIYFRTEKNLLALELETGRQIWSYQADEIRPNLDLDQQHLYVVTRKDSFFGPANTIRALALTTGQEKWSQALSAGGYSRLVQDGVVYAGEGALNAIDAATGKKLWSFKGTGRESAQLYSGGRIFLTSPTVTYFGTSRVDQGYLYAIDAKLGKL
jgi:outer membrane protein assembly factor BamB